MRIGAAAVALGLALPAPAGAQDALCEDPGGYCRRLAAPECLARADALTLETADPDCAAPLQAYRLCVLAADQCGSETGAYLGAGEGCDEIAARAAWRAVAEAGTCAGFRAFLASCPNAGRAPLAEAKLALCAAPRAGAAAPDRP